MDERKEERLEEQRVEGKEEGMGRRRGEGKEGGGRREEPTLRSEPHTFSLQRVRTGRENPGWQRRCNTIHSDTFTSHELWGQNIGG